MQYSAGYQIRSMDLNGRRIMGTVLAYDEIGTIAPGIYEAISKDAVHKVLAKDSDQRAYLEHDHSKLLGRTTSGTLRFDAGSEQLRFELDLPTTSHGEDALELVRRGDLTDVSFGFNPGSYRTAKAPDGSPVIYWDSFTSFNEVSLVSKGSYPSSKAFTRSFNPSFDLADVLWVGSRYSPDDYQRTNQQNLIKARARLLYRKD